MRLTGFSDLSIRVLLVAAANPDHLMTIDHTAELLDVSRAHLMKVVNTLTRAGFLKAFRGRSGGYTLANPPEDINLADVIIATEPDFAMVECMRDNNRCVLTKACKLPGVLSAALDAFQSVLRQYTLADIALSPKDIASLGFLVR